MSVHTGSEHLKHMNLTKFECHATTYVILLEAYVYDRSIIFLKPQFPVQFDLNKSTYNAYVQRFPLYIRIQGCYV